MIISVSPETTSLTVPRNQPVAMLLFLDNLRNLWIQRVLGWCARDGESIGASRMQSKLSGVILVKGLTRVGFTRLQCT